MKLFFKFCSWIIFILLITSCQVYHPLSKHNYFNNNVLYNDPLKIRFKYYGDIVFHPLSEVNRKEIKGITNEIKGVKSKDLIAYGTTNINPEYKILLFLKNSPNPSQINKDINLVLKDIVENKVLYQKSEGNQVAHLFLQAMNSNRGIQDITSDGFNLMRSWSFKSEVKEELDYSKVFSSNMENPNVLYVREKLINAPIPKNKQNKWMQFQYLATVNSFIADNAAYDGLIKNFESKRLNYLRPILDTLLNDPQIQFNDEVVEEISSLANDTRIVMLNENHWYPKHRLLAMKLLKPLKGKGYTHLALEALAKDQDSLINHREFPTFHSGYYTREAYFGHFIRKAKELGFEIIGYENQDVDINRDLGQAQNLAKLLKEDINNKIFVYAGLDHIIEEPTDKGKWMAGYLKEITEIDPLTINQVDVVSEGKYGLAMIPFELLEKKGDVLKPNDFYVINNLEPTIGLLYPNTVLQEVKIQEEVLAEYIGEKLLINIYDLDEYQSFRSRSVPLLSSLKKVSRDNAISIELPQGKYMIKIVSKKDDNVFLKEYQL